MAKIKTLNATDDKLDKMIDEAIDPRKSPDWVDFGDQEARDKAAKLQEEIQELKADPEANAGAIADREKQIGELAKRYKRLQVRIPNVKASRTIAKALAPHFHLLKDLAAVAERGEGDEQTDALEAMGPIVGVLADVLPECVVAAFETQGMTAAWLDEYADPLQLLNAAGALLAKLGMVDVLGKLSPNGGRSS